MTTRNPFAKKPKKLTKKEVRALQCKKRIRGLHQFFDTPIPKKARGECPKDCPRCYCRCPHCGGLLDKEKVARR